MPSDLPSFPHHLTAPPIASPVATSLNSLAVTLAYPLPLQAIISSASLSLTAHYAKTWQGDINTRTYDTLMEWTGTDHLGRTILLLITGLPSARHVARASTDTPTCRCVCACFQASFAVVRIWEKWWIDVNNRSPLILSLCLRCLYGCVCDRQVWVQRS